MEHRSHIGVVGAGFLAKGFVMALEEQPDLVISRVLTRTSVQERTDFPRQDLLTNSIDELIDNSDLVVECSGDVIHATDVIDKVLSASLPVVTMDSELQVTTGSYFVRRGFITEAEGDQPGCLAALRENVIQMGCTPSVSVEDGVKEIAGVLCDGRYRDFDHPIYYNMRWIELLVEIEDRLKKTGTVL